VAKAICAPSERVLVATLVAATFVSRPGLVMRSVPETRALQSADALAASALWSAVSVTVTAPAIVLPVGAPFVSSSGVCSDGQLLDARRRARRHREHGCKHGETCCTAHLGLRRLDPRRRSQRDG